MRKFSMMIVAAAFAMLRGSGVAVAAQTRRILLAAALAGALGLPAVPVGAANADTIEPRPSCTRIVGFSQTHQWAQAFLPHVPDAEWEAQIRAGDGVEQWAVGGAGWTSPVYSPCGTVTRVLMQVATGKQRTDAEFDQGF